MERSALSEPHLLMHSKANTRLETPTYESAGVGDPTEPPQPCVPRYETHKGIRKMTEDGSFATEYDMRIPGERSYVQEYTKIVYQIKQLRQL